MEKPLYRAQITHTDKTVEKLYKTQYYVYGKGQMLLRMSIYELRQALRDMRNK